MNIFFHMLFEEGQVIESHLSYYESVHLRCFLYFLHIVFVILITFTIFTLEALL